MPDPILFVGLGGSGTYTVAKLKSLLAQAVPQSDFDRFFQFRFVETDRGQLEKLRSRLSEDFQRKSDFIDPVTEWIHLGGFNPYAAYETLRSNQRDPANAEVLRWIDSDNARLFPNQPLEVGANAHRQLGRFAFAHHVQTIETSLTGAIQKLGAAVPAGQTQADLRVYVVTSSCGGTGSSMFFDTLLLLGAIRHQLAASLPRLRAVIYGPRPFIEASERQVKDKELIDRYSANAHAFFLELQFALACYHQKTDSGGRVALDIRQRFCRPSLPTMQRFGAAWRPFEGAIVLEDRIDGATPQFLSFTDGGMYNATAELLAGLVLAASGEIDSVFANPNRDQPSSATGTYPVYVTAGMKSVEFPATSFRRYLSALFVEDVVRGRYFAEPKRSVQELRDGARDWLAAAVLDPYRSETKPSFRSRVRREIFEEGTGELSDLTSVDSFFKPEENPEKPPVLDLTLLNRVSLASHRDEFLRKLDALRKHVRSEFLRLYGDPTDATGRGGLGAIRQELARWMEETLETEGVATWIGRPGSGGTLAAGLAQSLLDSCAQSLDEASRKLLESNDRYSKLKAGPSGLGALVDQAAERADQDRRAILFKKPSKELAAIVESIRSTQEQLAEEAFRNELLTLEIELLAWVGAHDRVDRTFDFFTTSERPSASFTSALKAQGERLAAWLTRALSQAEETEKGERSVLQGLGTSKTSRFLPPLDRLLVGDTPGDISEDALNQLRALVRGNPALPAFTEANGAERAWRQICAQPRETSNRELEEFLTGGRIWVERAIESRKTLKETVDRHVEEEIGRLTTREIGDLRTSLAAKDSVSAFCLLTGPGRQSKSDLLVLSTPSEAGDGSVARRLGFGDAPNIQHVKRPDAPYRVAMLRYMSGLVLESDFVFHGDLARGYRELQSYEPHISRNGRLEFNAEIQLAGGELRFKRLFAVGLAWAVALMRDKKKGAGKLADLAPLFTDRLKFEPRAYLSDGPIAIENARVRLFRDALASPLLDEQQKVSMAITLDRWEWISTGESRYDEAWAAFQKRELPVKNVESFHSIVAGLRHDWDTRPTSIRLVDPHRRAGAELYRQAVEDAGTAFSAKVRELEASSQPSAQSVSAVLGWVVNELRDELDSVQKTLSDGGGSSTDGI